MPKELDKKLPVFKLDDSREFLDYTEIEGILEDYAMVSGRRRYEPHALNVIASFDIEATSFYHDPKTGKAYSIDEANALGKRVKGKLEKRATMYAWGFGINGRVVFGRTWEDFKALLSKIRERYKLGKDLILKIFIQNESYEFQFLKDLMDWKSVFATSDRYPIRALTNDGFEFCDSLIISGMSLENMGESLLKYKVRKLVGSLDYRQLRHTGTPLTLEEKLYLKNDNLVLMAYMQELLEERKSVNLIPMTKTGFVRQDIREYCFWGGGSHHRDKDHRYQRYTRLMQSLTLSVDEYLLANRAFMGGFTHTSYLNSGAVLEDVGSLDIASDYPSIICSEMVPMSKGREVTPESAEEFSDYMHNYCCLFEVEIFNLESSFPYEHILSRSKCYDVTGCEEDNGRIIRAKHLITCWTEIDWECMEHFYNWDRFAIRKMYIYRRGYFPKAIIEKTLEYYKDKTELKGVEGMEAFYNRAKTMINAIFGMSVQKPISEDITYKDGAWVNETAEIRKDPEAYADFISKSIEKYNKSKSRFTSFLWGVWITAAARRNILSVIVREVKEDYIYTDTDSVKMLHPEKHKKYFDAYNRFMTAKIASCLHYYGIDEQLARPKTKNGVEKPLGVFEEDARYHRFCAKGAKRYFVDYGKPKDPDKPWSRYSLTISGVNKKTAIPAIYRWMEETGKDFFDYFTWGRVFDAESCGKLCHVYIDTPIEGKMVDYLGNEAEYKELSCVHLEESTYKLSASDEYRSLLSLVEHINTIVYID